jgi:pyruvate carboxylase subunit B
MKYYVTVEGREVVVDVDGDRVTVEGQPARAELRVVLGTPLRQLFLDGHSLVLSVLGQGRGSWVLGRRGEEWEVDVMDERTRHIRALTGAGKGPRGGDTIRAPMPGLVVRVLVQSGEVVEAGAGMVVLEAMKMENELRAVGAGVVQAVRVEPGMAVERGEVLVELAEEPAGSGEPA